MTRKTGQGLAERRHRHLGWRAHPLGVRRKLRYHNDGREACRVLSNGRTETAGGLEEPIRATLARAMQE